MKAKVSHFEIPAEDVDRAKKFYSEVFGWAIAPVPDMDYDIVQAAETDDKGMLKELGAINGGMMKRSPEVKHPVITIIVDDIDEAMRRVKGMGGKVTVEKLAVGDIGYSAYFEDPEGNVMGLFEAKMKPSAAATAEDLVLTRTFDAPRELVWRAWTDPELVKRWWGPRYFTAPFASIDLRVGGKYLFCMRAPDGKDYWSTGVYREIVPLERIVCTDSFADEKGNVVPATYYGMSADLPLELAFTVTFEARADKTEFTLRHAGFPIGSELDNARDGWSTSLDKLAEVLAQIRE